MYQCIYSIYICIYSYIYNICRGIRLGRGIGICIGMHRHVHIPVPLPVPVQLSAPIPLPVFIPQTCNLCPSQIPVVCQYVQNMHMHTSHNCGMHSTQVQEPAALRQVPGPQRGHAPRLGSRHRRGLPADTCSQGVLAISKAPNFNCLCMDHVGFALWAYQALRKQWKNTDHKISSCNGAL